MCEFHRAIYSRLKCYKGIRMALKAWLDSNYQSALCSIAKTKEIGGIVQSSSSENLLRQDGHFQAIVASLLSASSENFSSSIDRIKLTAGGVSEDKNHTILNNMTDMGLSVGPSALVADANSVVAKGPQLLGSASANVALHLNLPALPLYVPHTLTISGSSARDASSIEHQTSNLEQNSLQLRKRKQQRGRSATVCQPKSKNNQNSFFDGIKEELCASTQIHKKPKLDIKRDGILHQHSIHQPQQSDNSVQSQIHIPQVQELIQKHKLQNLRQEKVLQSILQLEGIDVRQKQQQQIRENHLQLPLQLRSYMQPLDSGVCSRRLMQYMYHIRQRPLDNGIAYWRKFVVEYYAPGAKKRWCLSLYDNIGHRAVGVFPQAVLKAWQCELCGSKSGRGFEATFDILPRLNKIKFENGVVSELWFLDLPHEHRLLSGLMVLEYGKAVQESVYEQLHVVHEGKLRVIFSHDLKIVSWEFCSWGHEELLPRRLVVPQVEQLVHATKKYQSAVDGNGSDRILPHDLQENCEIFQAAGHQLARSLELRLVDDLGFSRSYIRCLQIAEIVNSMKDLFSFSSIKNIGPIESLRSYARAISSTQPKKEEFLEKEQLNSPQGLPTGMDKLTVTFPGQTIHSPDGSKTTNIQFFTGSEDAAISLPEYNCKLMSQNSLASNANRLKQEPLELPHNGSSSSHSSKGKQNIQDLMIQQLVQEMINNSRAQSIGVKGKK